MKLFLCELIRAFLFREACALGHQRGLHSLHILLLFLSLLILALILGPFDSFRICKFCLFNQSQMFRWFTQIFHLVLWLICSANHWLNAIICRRSHIFERFRFLINTLHPSLAFLNGICNVFTKHVVFLLDTEIDQIRRFTIYFLTFFFLDFKLAYTYSCAHVNLLRLWTGLVD